MGDVRLPPDVAQAMKDARITKRDERGLMPIGDARAHLATVSTFGTWRTDAATSDRTWAALLSLENADEFVREAKRLVWEGSPRGMYNVAPFQRYGSGIRPWLLTGFNRETRTFTNQPWCLAPCLVLAGGEEAFEALLDAESLSTISYVHSETRRSSRRCSIGIPRMAGRSSRGVLWRAPQKKNSARS
jgi:hypothetical protein